MRSGFFLFSSLCISLVAGDRELVSGSLGPRRRAMEIPARFPRTTCLLLRGRGGDLDLYCGPEGRATGTGPSEVLFSRPRSSARVRIVWKRGAEADFDLMAVEGDSLGIVGRGARLRLPRNQSLGLWLLPEASDSAIAVTLDGPRAQAFVLDADLQIVAELTKPRVVVPSFAEPRWLAIVRRRADGQPLSWRAHFSDVSLPPLERFLLELAANSEQQEALEAMRLHPDGRAMLEYVASYPGKSPLRWEVIPGLTMEGIERFGGYDGAAQTLIVNPQKAEHVENPAELVDTVAHELLHMILDLPRKKSYPFSRDVLDSQTDPRLNKLNGLLRKDSVAGNLKDYLDREYGDGISDPDQEYIDINAAAQYIVIKIVEDVLARTGKGHRTRVFANEDARTGK